MLIHSDLAGPFKVPSLNDSVYWLTFLDDYSNYVTIYFLKPKTEVCQKIKDFVIQSENQTGYKMKYFRSDQDTEYCNKSVDEFFKKKVIIHQTTVRYSPEENGRSE